MNDMPLHHGEYVPSTSMERFDLAAEDGFRLSAMRWAPKTPSAILQISHGVAEYAARYAPFAAACAAACAAAGIAVYMIIAAMVGRSTRRRRSASSLRKGGGRKSLATSTRCTSGPAPST